MVPEPTVVLLPPLVRNLRDLPWRQLEAGQLGQEAVQPLFLTTRGKCHRALVNHPAQGNVALTDAVLSRQ